MCHSTLLGVVIEFHVRRNDLIVLAGLCMLDLAQALVGRSDSGIITIEHYSHIFQAVSSRFRVGEPDGYKCNDKHHDKDQVVFPCDTSQGDGIDEDVE